MEGRLSNTWSHLPTTNDNDNQRHVCPAIVCPQYPKLHWVLQTAQFRLSRSTTIAARRTASLTCVCVDLASETFFKKWERERMVIGDYIYRALCDSVANGMYAWVNWASAQTLAFRSVGSSAQPACGSLQIASNKLFDLHRKQTWHNSHCKIATTAPCTSTLRKVVEPTSSTSSFPNLSTAIGICRRKKCRVDGSTTQ